MYSFSFNKQYSYVQFDVFIGMHGKLFTVEVKSTNNTSNSHIRHFFMEGGQLALILFWLSWLMFTNITYTC